MKKVILYRTLILLLLSFIALYYEKASFEREIILTTLTIILLIIPFIKKINYGSIIFEIGVIFLLNYYSRFNINMIFVTFYLVLIIECFFFGDRKKSIFTSIFAIIFLFINFLFILQYGSNYELITQMIFLELVLILVSINLFFVTSYLEEKNNVVRLTKLAERSEMASSLHDTIGHEMTGLIMELEMAKMICPNSLIDDATENARKILKTLRETVDSLNNQEINGIFYENLVRKIEDFMYRTKIDINFVSNIPFDKLTGPIRLLIYRTILESMTNIGKHSNGEKMNIEINGFGEEKLRIIIEDNGSGKSKINEGNGIKFIRERVENIGGTLDYEIHPINGFRMIIEIRSEYDD